MKTKDKAVEAHRGQMTIKLEPEVREAVERMARDNDRSLAVQFRVLIREALSAKGF